MWSLLRKCCHWFQESDKDIYETRKILDFNTEGGMAKYDVSPACLLCHGTVNVSCVIIYVIAYDVFYLSNVLKPKHCI